MGFPFENATWRGLDAAKYMGVNSNAALIYALVAAGICGFVPQHPFMLKKAL